MDFKTELQNLVNRYPGMIKKVKVEFVKEIEVAPNGQSVTPNNILNVQYKSMPPGVTNLPPQLAVTPKVDAFEMTETRYVDTPARPKTKAEMDVLHKTMEALKPPQI